MLQLIVFTPAFALTQPSGNTIPTSPGSINALFDTLEEPLDAVTDAQAPLTVVPTGPVTFTVHLRNAGYVNGFGWYNVTGAVPDPSDLHEVIACSDDVGAEVAIDISSDPAYTGGAIGFFEVVGMCGSVSDHEYLLYSEVALNYGPNDVMYMIQYTSGLDPNRVYFGWEDFPGETDGDFDDLFISMAAEAGPSDTDSDTDVVDTDVVDTEVADTDVPADSEAPVDSEEADTELDVSDKKGKCGCQSGAMPWGWGALSMLFLARRRRG